MTSNLVVTIIKETVQLLLFLLQRGILEGEIVEANGDSLANVKVILKSPDGRLIGEDVTFLSGRFVFPKIKEGKYELFAEYGNEFFAADKIYLRKGRATSIKIKLPVKKVNPINNITHQNDYLLESPAAKPPFTQDPFPKTPLIKQR